ncbi:hypothetical protein LPY66_04285 [Dehalobacter sp. DCM]|nr:hypothetical protein LPY66_04285 [Dehalobacter sp. DCM]
MHHSDIEYAELDQEQLTQIQQAESQLNTKHRNLNEEVILLAFSKKK